MKSKTALPEWAYQVPIIGFFLFNAVICWDWWNRYGIPFGASDVDNYLMQDGHLMLHWTVNMLLNTFGTAFFAFAPLVFAYPVLSLIGFRLSGWRGAFYLVLGTYIVPYILYVGYWQQALSIGAYWAWTASKNPLWAVFSAFLHPIAWPALILSSSDNPRTILLLSVALGAALFFYANPFLYTFLSGYAEESGLWFSLFIYRMPYLAFAGFSRMGAGMRMRWGISSLVHNNRLMPYWDAEWVKHVHPGKHERVLFVLVIVYHWYILNMAYSNILAEIHPGGPNYRPGLAVL